MTETDKEPMHLKCSCGELFDEATWDLIADVRCSACGRIPALTPDEVAALKNRMNRQVADTAGIDPLTETLEHMVRDAGLKD